MTPIITADNPTDALIEAHDRGIEVTIIIDDDGKQGTESDYQRILDAGVDIRSDNSVAQMNHSIMIIDGQIVTAGSNLWSEPSESDNYSAIIIRSKSVSTLYMEEFNRIWEQTLSGT
jgi:phosphatidylserine/phosphatidylglycerophosphate/cardiolipin synthase-like enzyme